MFLVPEVLSSAVSSLKQNRNADGHMTCCGQRSVSVKVLHGFRYPRVPDG